MIPTPTERGRHAPPWWDHYSSYSDALRRVPTLKNENSPKRKFQQVLNVGAWNPQESGRKAPLSWNAAFSMLQWSFSFAAAQLLVQMTSTLQKSRCCSAVSAAQHSENCSATSVFACGMLQGWGLEGWGLGLAESFWAGYSADVPGSFVRTSRIKNFGQALKSLEKEAFGCGHPCQREFLRVRRGCQASQRKGRTSGEVRKTSGEVWGTSGEVGNLQGTPGLLLSSTVRELPGKSPKNFRGSLGNFRGSPGTFQKFGGDWSPPSDSPNFSPTMTLTGRRPWPREVSKRLRAEKLRADFPLPESPAKPEKITHTQVKRAGKKKAYTTTVETLLSFSGSEAFMVYILLSGRMVYTLFPCFPGKMVSIIVFLFSVTSESGDRTEKGGVPRWWCILFFSLKSARQARTIEPQHFFCQKVLFWHCIIVTWKCSYRPRNPKIQRHKKVTQKWLSAAKVTQKLKVTQKWLKMVRKGTFESLLSNFWVTFK